MFSWAHSWYEWWIQSNAFFILHQVISYVTFQMANTICFLKKKKKIVWTIRATRPNWPFVTSSGDNTPTQPNLNGLGWVEWKFGLGLGQIFESYVSLGSNPIHLIFKKKKKKKKTHKSTWEGGDEWEGSGGEREAKMRVRWREEKGLREW